MQTTKYLAVSEVTTPRSYSWPSRSGGDATAMSDNTLIVILIPDYVRDYITCFFAAFPPRTPQVLRFCFHFRAKSRVYSRFSSMMINLPHPVEQQQVPAFIEIVIMR